MTFRDFLAAQLGGAIPLVRTDRTVHAMDGATYRIELTWLRRRFGQDYHTPRLPRKIRKARAAEYARLIASDNERRVMFHEEPGMAEKLAAGHRFEVGDIIPSWVREIPDYVTAVKNGKGDVYTRPVGDQRYYLEDGAAEPDRSMEYPWVSLYDPGNGDPVQVACYSSESGVFEHEPMIVTKVAVETGDAREAA